MITIAQALKSLHPNCEFVTSGDQISKWLSPDIPQPTEAEIQAEITRLQAEYAAKQYQRARAAEYPSLAEQLDMLYWDEVNGTTTWADAIAAVKAQYPKPEGV